MATISAYKYEDDAAAEAALPKLKEQCKSEASEDHLSVSVARSGSLVTTKVSGTPPKP